MGNPLVSVIIPAYNHARYVEECIRSIIGQTYPELELLVIDDGSSDRTWEILQSLKSECEKRFCRVVMERQENQGTCITMNRLLALSRGKYLYDIASDDAAVPEAIEVEVRFLEEHPDYVLAVGNDDIIDEASEKIAWDKHRNVVPVGTRNSFSDFANEIMTSYNANIDYYSEDFGSYRSLLAANYIANGYTFRKSALGGGDFFTPEAPLEDWYLMLQLSKAGKMKYIDRILYHYRWHETNTMKKSDHVWEMRCKTLQFELRHCKDPRYRKYLDLYTAKANEPMSITRLKYRLYNLAEIIAAFLVLSIRFIRKIFCWNFWNRSFGRLRNELIMSDFAVSGKYNRFGKDTQITAPKKLEMGDYCVIGNQFLLDLSTAEKAVIGSHVQIGDNCMIRCSGKLEIENNCKIRNGTVIDVDGDVVIGSFSVIGYYSVITETLKLEPHTIYSSAHVKGEKV